LLASWWRFAGCIHHFTIPPSYHSAISGPASYGQHPTYNIQHPTSNGQQRATRCIRKVDAVDAVSDLLFLCRKRKMEQISPFPFLESPHTVMPTTHFKSRTNRTAQDGQKDIKRHPDLNENAVV